MTQNPTPGWHPTDDHTERWWDGHQWTDHHRPRAAPAYVPQPRSDQRTNGAELAAAWIVTVLTLGYMLPWAVAATRGKANSGAIAVVNFLVGWTLIGWIIALVMACGAHQRYVA